MAGVVVGQGEYQTGCFDHLHQTVGLIEGVRHGLIAHHMDTRLQESATNIEMRHIRGHNADKIDPAILGQPGLGLGHLGIGLVDPVRRQVELRPGRPVVVSIT